MKDDSAPEAKEAQEHQADTAEDRAGHPMQVVAERVQGCGEALDQIVELSREMAGTCPCSTGRRHRRTGDIVEAPDHGAGHSVEVGPVGGEEPCLRQLDEIPEEAGASMLRNRKAMLMQTPISESVTINRATVPVLLATAPNRDLAASARKPSAVSTIHLTMLLTGCLALRIPPPVWR